MRTMGLKRLGVAAALVVVMGCSPNWRITRTDPEKTIDYDYRFDDEDARQVYRGMVTDCLARPWIDRWEASRGARPVVIVGRVRNDTHDYIETRMFSRRIEEELINSGRVRVVAEPDQRAELRDERAAAADWSRPETVKQMAYELGADFMMLGWIGDHEERTLDGRSLVKYYMVNMEMIDIESNEKVWSQSEEIKKQARR
jgi:uncharacterized protein (TIGR02722 family)